jgi:hypothetical protein
MLATSGKGRPAGQNVALGDWVMLAGKDLLGKRNQIILRRLYFTATLPLYCNKRQVHPFTAIKRQRARTGSRALYLFQGTLSFFNPNARVLSVVSCSGAPSKVQTSPFQR